VVIDEASIEKRETAHAWLPERFAHLDGPQCMRAESRTDIQLKGLPDIPAGVTKFLRGEALLADSAKLLASVSGFGAAVHRQGALPDPAAITLSGHCLIAIILAGLQDASRLDETPAETLRSRLERALTVGNADDVNLLPLLERADAVIRHLQLRTHRADVAAGADPINIDVPSLRDTVATPPPYLSDYLDFVERLRSNPQVSKDLLQTAELVCFDTLLGDENWAAAAFAHLFTPEHRSLLLVALRCLGRVAGETVSGYLHRISEVPFIGLGSKTPDRYSTPSSSTDLKSTQNAVKSESSNNSQQLQIPVTDDHKVD
jgi:hypothetical protein